MGSVKDCGVFVVNFVKSRIIHFPRGFHVAALLLGISISVTFGTLRSSFFKHLNSSRRRELDISQLVASKAV